MHYICISKSILRYKYFPSNHLLNFNSIILFAQKKIDIKNNDMKNNLIKKTFLHDKSCC